MRAPDNDTFVNACQLNFDKEETNTGKMKNWLSNIDLSNLSALEPVQVDDTDKDYTSKDNKVLTSLEPLNSKNNINVDVDFEPHLEPINFHSKSSFVINDYVDSSTDDDASNCSSIFIGERENLIVSPIAIGGEIKDVNSKRNPLKRKRWFAAEITVMKKEFGFFLKKKIYPSGDDIKKFTNKRKMNRTVPVVRPKLQHLMKTSDF